MSSETYHPELSCEDILEIARKSAGPEVNVVDYNQRHYADEKVGFICYHGLLTIRISDITENTRVLNFFVKGVPYDNQAQVDWIEENKAFQEELRFYKKILPVMTEEYDIKKWAPIVYLVREDLLIFEDLKTTGFKMPKSNPLSMMQLKSTVKTLAHFHAGSILAEHKLSKSLEEEFPDAFYEKLIVTSRDNWFEPGLDMIVALAEALNFPESGNLHQVCRGFADLLKPSENHRNVICHGDLWINNLMFNETQTDCQCILVDFQIIRYAPLVIDLLQLFYITLENENRKKYERELLELYCKELEVTIRKNNEFAEIPTLREVRKAYEDLRLAGAIFAALYLPVCLMDPDYVHEYTKDSEGFRKFAFIDRREAVINYLNNNIIYRNRLKDNFIELIRICRSTIF